MGLLCALCIHMKRNTIFVLIALNFILVTSVKFSKVLQGTFFTKAPLLVFESKFRICLAVGIVV